MSEILKRLPERQSCPNASVQSVLAPVEHEPVPSGLASKFNQDFLKKRDTKDSGLFEKQLGWAGARGTGIWKYSSEYFENRPFCVQNCVKKHTNTHVLGL